MEDIKSFYAKTIRNLEPEQLNKYHKKILRKYIYGTNAMEGLQLTEAEVNALLTDELVPKNRPTNDVWAVYNLKRLEREDFCGPIDIPMIKQIHKSITKNIVDSNGKPVKGGEFRTEVVAVGGMFRLVSKPDKIEQGLNELLKWKEDVKMDPIEVSAIFHARFELIRPFLHFNGQVGRHILNLMLIREGLPAIYTVPEQRTIYLNDLQETDLLNYCNLVEFLTKRICASLHDLRIVSSEFQILQSIDAFN